MEKLEKIQTQLDMKLSSVLIFMIMSRVVALICKSFPRNRMYADGKLIFALDSRKTSFDQARSPNYILRFLCALSFCLPNLSVASSDYAEQARFQSGLAQLKKLDSEWDIVSKGGGDNIRRYLGTVYTPPTCTSPLCSYSNFLTKYAQAHLDDLDLGLYEEASGELVTALNQADFLAYSSIFSEYGNGGGGKNYIAESHTQVRKAIDALEHVLDIIE